MICPRCNSNNVIIQQQTETKNKLRIGAALLLSPLALANPKTKTTTKTVAVCQNCGNTFNPAFAAYEKEPNQHATTSNKPANRASSASPKNIADELEKYNSLLERGVISQDEFDVLKKGLFENMSSSTECDEPIYTEPAHSTCEQINNVKSSTSDAPAAPVGSDNIADLRFNPPVRKGFRTAFWVCLVFAWIYGLLAATLDISMFMPCVFFVGLAVFFLFHSMTSKNQTRFSVFGYVCPLSKKAVSWIIAVFFIVLVSVLANTMDPSASTTDTSGSDMSGSSVQSSSVSDTDTSNSDAA